VNPRLHYSFSPLPVSIFSLRFPIVNPLSLFFLNIGSALRGIMTDPASPSPLRIRSSTSLDASYTIRLDMKDVTSTKHTRNSLIYPKKRPSPHGISKPHKSPLLPANGLARRTPRTTKVALIQQRQREAQIQALRREGIFLEEEYHDEIRYYMLDMEVSAYCLLMTPQYSPCML
jgi:hypothetical protein